jgi:hypothetical protein
MAARRRRGKKVVPDRPREARKVYVETSVWGMTLENQPRALREPTRQFLRQCAAGIFLPYISTVVLREIALAEASAAAQMVREINQLAPVALEPSAESEELAEAYLEAGVIPAKKRGRRSPCCHRDCRRPRYRGKLESSAPGQRAEE